MRTHLGADTNYHLAHQRPAVVRRQLAKLKLLSRIGFKGLGIRARGVGFRIQGLGFKV
jgi:hypothetical protein